jgi:hypothetical protein
MKKLLVLTSALLIGGASIASAAPGCNLSWLNCATTATSSNWAFTCDDNYATRNLIGSFTPAAALADFAGLTGVIDWQIGAAGTPDYFQYGSGGCREGAIGPINVGGVAGCTSPYLGTLGQGGGFNNVQTNPNRWQITVDWARSEGSALAAGTRYTGFVLQFSTTGAWDEGFGGECVGCGTPVCYVMNRLDVFGFTNGLHEQYTGPDFRNWATYQGGAVGGTGCPGETPTKNATWGAVKALYR